MSDKATLPDSMRQSAGIGGKSQPRNGGVARNAGSRLAELQRAERKRMDRFGRFGGR